MDSANTDPSSDTDDKRSSKNKKVDKLVIWQSHKQELVELVESVHDEVEDDQYRQCFIRYLQHKGLIAQGSHTYSAIIDELDQKIVADPEHLVELQKVLEQDMHLYTVGLKMRYQLEDITLDKLRLSKDALQKFLIAVFEIYKIPRLEFRQDQSFDYNFPQHLVSIGILDYYQKSRLFLEPNLPRLMNCLEEKIIKKPTYLHQIMKLMDKHDYFHDLVKELKDELGEDEQADVDDLEIEDEPSSRTSKGPEDLLDFWDKYRDTFLETCGENLFDKEKQYFAKQLERDDLIDLKDPDGTAMKAAIEERVLKEPKFILKLIRFMKRSFELYPIGVGSSYTLEDPTTDGNLSVSVLHKLLVGFHKIFENEALKFHQGKSFFPNFSEDLMSIGVIQFPQYCALCTSANTNEVLVELLEMLEKEILKNSRMLTEIMNTMDKYECCHDLVLKLRVAMKDKPAIWQSHKQELLHLVEGVHDKQHSHCFIRYLQHKGLIEQGSHTYSAIIDELDQKIVADPEHLVEVQKVFEQDMYLYTVGLKMRYQLEDITLDKLSDLSKADLRRFLVGVFIQCSKPVNRSFPTDFANRLHSKAIIDFYQASRFRIRGYLPQMMKVLEDKVMKQPRLLRFILNEMDTFDECHDTVQKLRDGLTEDKQADSPFVPVFENENTSTTNREKLLDFWDKNRTLFPNGEMLEAMSVEDRQYLYSQVKQNAPIEPTPEAISAAIDQKVADNPQFILELVKILRKNYDTYTIGLNISHSLQVTTTDKSLSNIVCRLVTKLHEITQNPSADRPAIVEGLAEGLMTSSLFDMTQFMALCTEPESDEAVIDLLEVIESQILKNPKILPQVLLQMDKQELLRDLVQELREELRKDSSQSRKCPQCLDMEAKLNQTVKEMEKETLRQQKKASQLKVNKLPDVLSVTAAIHHQWKELGLALGIPMETLVTELSNDSHSTLRHLYEMFRYWVEDLGGSWGNLIGALKNPNVDQDELADFIENELQGDDHEIHPFFSKPVGLTNETALKDADISNVVEVVFTTKTIDWKILGLLMGLSHRCLSQIDHEHKDSESNCQSTLLKEWVGTGRAYWSVLVNIIGGPVIGEKKRANDIIFSKGIDLQPFPYEEINDDFEISEEDIAEKDQEIMNAIGANYKKTKGVVIFVGVSDCGGTDVDANSIRTTFKEELGFCFFPLTNPKRNELSCLIKAVARSELTFRCKTVVFYYAGHGGINEREEPFIKLSDGKFRIREDILRHFSGDLVDKSRRYLFFFDSCLSGASVKSSLRLSIPNIPLGCLLAHATSFGSVSHGFLQSGGVWTRHLCEYLKQSISVSDALDHSYTSVSSELKGGNAQYPTYMSRTGAVFLKGHPNLGKDDSSQISDPVEIWEHHGEELKTLLSKSSETLLSLTGGMFSKEIIDEKANTKVVENYHVREGPECLYKEVLKLLKDNQEISLLLLNNILEVMDVQDQLCGLVRRMRNLLNMYKGGNILRERRDEILDQLQANKTTLLPIAGALRTFGIIDSQTNMEICSKEFAMAPQKLLKCLEREVDEKSESLITICDVVEKYECLRKIAVEMKEKYMMQVDGNHLMARNVKETRQTATMSFNTTVTVSLVSGKCLNVKTTML